MKEMTRMGMHSWSEGQGAWNGGLMQRRNVPKELILVDFQEVTTCPTCVEKSKHCVGSKCPGKQSSGVPYCPASAFWALSKHALTSQSEGPLCLQLQQLLPTWSLSLEPTLLLLLSFLLSISGMAPLPWPTLGCCLLCSDVGNYISFLGLDLLTIDHSAHTKFSLGNW